MYRPSTKVPQAVNTSITQAPSSSYSPSFYPVLLNPIQYTTPPPNEAHTPHHHRPRPPPPPSPLPLHPRPIHKHHLPHGPRPRDKRQPHGNPMLASDRRLQHLVHARHSRCAGGCSEQRHESGYVAACLFGGFFCVS